MLLLFFGEINPKIYAAYNPHKLAFLFARPIRGVMILFAPLVKAFTFLSSLLFHKSREHSPSLHRTISRGRDQDLPDHGRPGHVAPSARR